MRARLTTLALASLLAVHSSAHAQPAAAANQADTLFAEGQALLQKGNLAEACAKMEASYALDPAQGTLLNMAFCHEKQGRLGLSFREYRRAAARAERENDQGRHRFASGHATELEAKLVHLEWPAAQQKLVVAIAVDGDAVEGDPNRVFVEPGKHVLEVKSTTGRHEQVVQVGPLVGRSLVVPLALPPPAQPPSAPPKSAPFAAPPDGSNHDGSGTKKIVGWTTIGVGAAAIGLGAGFGIGTFSEKSSAERTCRGELCDAEGMSHANRANTFAVVSTIAFAVGLVAIGAGTYLVLSPSSAGVSGTF